MPDGGPTLDWVQAPSILVVEDDPAIGNGLVAVLREEGYDARLEPTAAGALAAAQAVTPQLVLLDLGLPDVDGLSVCRQLRGRFPLTRIVMVTARGEEADVVVGFDTGADDYVTKPFRLGELLARVRAQLRPPSDTAPPSLLTIGDLEIDADSRRVRIGGVERDLRRKEFDLLSLLARHAGTVVTRERIMAEVWETDQSGGTKTLDMHVSNLRKKVADSRVNITTLRHVGYRLDA
jgi:DNA-binding response OmpR family regulator